MNKLYPKLAFTNIKNNKQFYFPYLLTGVLCVLMFYSMLAIQQNPALESMRGGTNLKVILMLGSWVIGFFACIFLFYTNSFIVKRRKKELGIYNILGMEKRHIACVMTMETIVLGFIVIVAGLVTGIVFNKLLMMFLYRLTGLSVSIPFYISIDGCVMTALLFAAIFVATLIYNFMQIRLANPIQLLRSDKTGEKEPKTKIVMTITGIACIAVGYYIAITEENPLKVLMLFFVAVILVIIGTYFLFIAGSVALLKLLRKNKNYYYKTNHFIAVSGMIYRMKQNAVGLANICILSTMVLVMVSCTVSLYFGVEDDLNYRYPHEITATVLYGEDAPRENDLKEVLLNAVDEAGGEATNVETKETFYIVGTLSGETLSLENKGDDMALSDYYIVNFCTKDDYEKMTGEEVCELDTDEIATAFAPLYKGGRLVLGEKVCNVKENLSYKMGQAYMFTGGEGYVIVKDEEALRALYQELAEEYRKLDGSITAFNYEVGIDIAGTAEEKLAVGQAVWTVFNDWNYKESEKYLSGDSDAFYGGITYETRQGAYENFYSLYGGIFFLGMFLGVMFLMVTVLIIFYKQISEGYEDKERFAIMEKVGMSNAEVKASINAQVRIVFFLPLVTAVIHLTAAFPMLTKLLTLMNLMNQSVFVVCLIATVAVFTLFYLFVFKLTSKTYYKIVGNQVNAV